MFVIALYLLGLAVMGCLAQPQQPLPAAQQPPNAAAVMGKRQEFGGIGKSGEKVEKLETMRSSPGWGFTII
jgi:hypothetical protein